MTRKRIFLKVTRDMIPQVKDKFPFLYLERGRLEVDDSSVMWIDADRSVLRLPIATINSLLLGPGTTITHAAVKVAASVNCSISWVGEEGLLFYAAGHVPTANTKNFRRQMLLSASPKKSTEVARRLFSQRFSSVDLEGKSLKQMMGIEGYRVRQLYADKAEEYGVGWKGRVFDREKFETGDVTNKILTSCNAALYGILISAVHSLGYSPHIGFIHSGSPLPFIYDLADLYKADLTIDLAFKLTLELGGKYDKDVVSNAFRERLVEFDLLKKVPNDIKNVLRVGE